MHREADKERVEGEERPFPDALAADNKKMSSVSTGVTDGLLQQLQVEVLPRSLYLLIPMIPARTVQRSRANLLAFKPRSLVVASRQRSPQNAVKSSGKSMDNLFSDDKNK